MNSVSGSPSGDSIAEIGPRSQPREMTLEDHPVERGQRPYSDAVCVKIFEQAGPDRPPPPTGPSLVAPPWSCPVAPLPIPEASAAPITLFPQSDDRGALVAAEGCGKRLGSSAVSLLRYVSAWGGLHRGWGLGRRGPPLMRHLRSLGATRPDTTIPSRCPRRGPRRTIAALAGGVIALGAAAPVCG